MSSSKVSHLVSEASGLLFKQVLANDVKTSETPFTLQYDEKTIAQVNKQLLALPGRSHGLVDIGTCNLHICHNAFGKGLGVFANEISEFVINLHWWFKQSATRREDFEAVQQELGLAQHKFLKHVESRWLSPCSCTSS